MPLSEAQGRWVAEYLKGEYALPAADRAAARTSPRTSRRCRSATSPPSATRSRSTSTTTSFDLAREIKAGEQRAQARGFALPVPPRAGAEAEPAAGVSDAPVIDAPAAGKREATKAANRAAILAAARVVFADIGFGAASVRDIIRRTDLATGTFYNYFPDKESVLREILDETTERDPRARARGAARRDERRGLRPQRLSRLLRVPRRATARRSS